LGEWFHFGLVGEPERVDSGDSEAKEARVEDRERERFMLPILLPILLIVGIICCVRPDFFLKRPGLRLGVLLRLFPEQHRLGVIRVLGVVAVFGSVVGLVQLIRIW
jgi:hypothetical protein